MALLKTYPSSYGNTISYWKIGRFSVDCVEPSVYIHLFGYIDKVSRDAGKFPIETKVICLRGQSALDLMNSAPISGPTNYAVVAMALYNNLKSLEDWSDALDI